MVIPASRTVDVEPPPLQVLPAGANQQCAGGGRAWLGLRARARVCGTDVTDW